MSDSADPTPARWRGNRGLLLVTLVVVIAVAVSIAVGSRQLGASAGSASIPGASASPTAAQSGQAADIADIVQRAMATGHLKAVIVQVSVDDRVITSQAFGHSMTGVPATTDMHFRNGAVAFEYISTLLLRYVDQDRVNLDDTIDKWMPSLPESGEVTLRMLANQTSGYPDFETDPDWTAAYNADPFHAFTFDERLAYAFGRPLQFAPGTNWSYSHTNFMILGELLSMIGGAPLDQLLQQEVIEPLGLAHTHGYDSSTVPEPALHAFSSERRVALGIPPGTPFYEESTYWNPMWGTPVGAAQTTDITDMRRTAIAVGTGELLSPDSLREMTDSKLIGFGSSLPVCGGSCFTQVDGYNYGLGIVRSGSWQLQNPLMSGYSGTAAYLPKEKIAIAVVATFKEEAFAADGTYDNASDRLFRQIGAYLAPDDAPPTRNPTK